MFEFLKWVWFSPLIGLSGLVVGVIGIILYRNSRIGALPTCQMKTHRLIGLSEQELPPNVKILFDGDPVPRLSVTHLYFWNRGKETIQGDQVVEDDSLRCVFQENDEILKAHIGAVTRDVNKWSVQIPKQAKHTARLSFDFLDPGDGVRLDLLHTSCDRYPSVLGTLRGIPKGVKDLTSVARRSIAFSAEELMKKKNSLYGVALGLGLGLLIIGLLPAPWILGIAHFLKGDAPTTLRLMRFIFLIAGGIYTLMPIVSILEARKKYPVVLDKDFSEDEEKAEQQN